MTDNINQGREEKARNRIGRMLVEADWLMQSTNRVGLSANKKQIMSLQAFCWRK